MAALPVIVISALIIFLCRLAGFALNIRQPSEFYRAFLRFVPVAVFTVLVVSALFKQPDTLPQKLAALLIAAGVMKTTRRFAVSIMAGLVSLWLLLAIFPG